MPHAYVEQQISDDCQENACGQRERSYSGTAIEHGSAYEFHPQGDDGERFGMCRGILSGHCAYLVSMPFTLSLARSRMFLAVISDLPDGETRAPAFAARAD